MLGGVNLAKITESAPTTNKRQLSGIIGKIIIALMVLGSLFHLYTGGFGLFSTMTQRSIHVMFMLVPVFFLYSATIKGSKKLPWYDIAFGVLTLISSLYIFLTWTQQTMRVGDPPLMQLVFGAIMIIAVLEGTRRTSGNALMLTATILLLYTYFGKYMPGALAHRGYSANRIISFFYSTSEGIYGIPIGVSAALIVLFVVFGSVLNATGGGKFFINTTYALTGRLRGGTAKTSVIASALMGMISGSPIANVVTTGTFTIPLMKKGGYSPELAAAVSALASSGGILMPPVMGAAAFIMAEYLGVSYQQVVWAALIPSILFFASIFFIVDLEAAKKGLVGLKKEELPSIVQAFKEGWHLAIPIIALITFLIMKWSASKAVFWAIVILLVVAYIVPSTRLNLRGFIKALESGAREAIPIAVACASAGIIVGSLALTGLGVMFSSSIISLSGGSQIIALFLAMIGSLILGMGMPATAVYIVAASLLAPPLVDLGIPPIGAHFFIFYFSVISCITPPVALTSYAAAGIANTDANKVGWTAFYYGILAYIIPYLFVYSPVLLGQGSITEIIIATGTALLGIYAIGIALQGYFKGPVRALERLFFFGAGILALIPEGKTDILGIVLVIILMLANFHLASKREKFQTIQVPSK
ncbi:MAG: hypothetical protein JM58_00945 [Peptococcaceae bacterium BICA1-8]|nr:MAG: hypothetical protein JM58_00945 [Peptococcaceae bacterium BICA1-8]